MGDYDELCEMYGINPGDPEGSDKILDKIFACDNLKPKYRNRVSNGQWIPAPSGLIGNLERWKEYMKENYPFPEIGAVIHETTENGERIGYKCTSYNGSEPQWLRVAWQETPNQQNIEDSDGFDDDVPF
jgi:hypothetical protein